MTSTNEQPQSSGDTKAAVLNAAQRLITQFGYAGFSMRDLAKHCGLAKATLYHHFTDKHEIVLQVLQRDLTHIRDMMAEAADLPGDIRTRLRNVILAYFRIVTEQGMVLASTLRQASQSEDEFIKIIFSYRNELHRPIMNIFLKAQEDGEIGDVNLEMATISFFGILQSFTNNYLFMKNIKFDDPTVDFITDFVLHGLKHHPAQNLNLQQHGQALEK